MILKRVNNRGFTLIELLIVIGIIGILAAAIFLLLNPIAYFDRARDSNRIQDAGSFRQTLDFNIVQRGGKWDPDGTYTDSCVGESNQRVFVSVPSDNGETEPNDLPSGWNYKRVPEADVRNINGSGWVPVDLTGTGAGSPLSVLPVDPTNTFASGHYYSYVCSRIGDMGDYEITARMASERFRTGGDGDIQSGDGGDDIFVYETGSDLQLDPKAPVGHWSFNEGTGAIIGDDSGNENNGIFTNGATWENSDCVLGNCLLLPSFNDFVTVDTTGAPELRMENNMTMGLWMKMEQFDQGGWPPFFDRIPESFQIDMRPNDEMRARWDTNLTNGNVSQSNEAGNTGEWRHYIIKREGNLGYIYVDGNFEDSIAVNGIFDSSAGSYLFANFVSGNPDVWEDEGLVYDRPLDSVEIEYQYESLRP